MFKYGFFVVTCTMQNRATIGHHIMNMLSNNVVFLDNHRTI
jgi:hypothetical protein